MSLSSSLSQDVIADIINAAIGGAVGSVATTVIQDAAHGELSSTNEIATAFYLGLAGGAIGGTIGSEIGAAVAASSLGTVADVAFVCAETFEATASGLGNRTACPSH